MYQRAFSPSMTHILSKQHTNGQHGLCIRKWNAAGMIGYDRGHVEQIVHSVCLYICIHAQASLKRRRRHAFTRAMQKGFDIQVTRPYKPRECMYKYASTGFKTTNSCAQCVEVTIRHNLGQFPPTLTVRAALQHAVHPDILRNGSVCGIR